MPLLTPPPEALSIVERLRRAGHETYFCGGCVRDALLGKTPKDYDIATAATPDEVERLFAHTIPIGKAFGVILVQGLDNGQYEVATFRNDLGYADGRRPDAVQFSSAEEDARRRDFTLNALFYDHGRDRVIDYVGGVRDIHDRLLRTVGLPEERFEEDRLRLLRAVRFTARTGFTMEARTKAAVKAMAGKVLSVSPERIAAELETMLSGGYSSTAFALLKEVDLLRHVLPEVEDMDGVEQPPDFHPEGDVWQHTLFLLEENDHAVLGTTRPIDYSRIANVDAERGMSMGDFTPEQYIEGVRECRGVMQPLQTMTLAWCGLLHDIGKPGTFTIADRIRFNEHDLLGAEMAVAVLERLRRPRKMIDWSYDLIRRHIHFSTLRKMRKSKLRRWLADENFPLHLELHRLDCVSSHRMLANWYFGLESWREERARPPKPEPLLRGTDLLALGMQPGPQVGELLRLVEDACLEGVLTTRDQALDWARERLASGDYTTLT